VGKNGEIVRSFCRAWSRTDAGELLGFFTEDAVYHNMMLPPLAGKAAIEAGIRGFLGGWSDVDWEIRNLVEEGDVVFSERVDRGRANGKPFALPVVGVFELAGGKIRAWRDYFDLATYTKAVG
jgi:limonene-1,2-epoxide hydrolase